MIDSTKLSELLEVCRKHGVDYFESDTLKVKFSPLGVFHPVEQSTKIIPDIQSYQSIRDYDTLHGIPSIDEDDLS